MRKRIAASMVVVLVLGLSGWVDQPPAGADPAPWTWIQVTESATVGVSQPVIATCPTGYSAVTGGWDYASSGASIKDVTIAGPRFTVDSGDGGQLTVSVWCAKSSQVDIQIVHRTLTVAASGSYWRGHGDFGCGSGMTPLSASLNWTKDPLYTLQSGPETVGGVNEWFVAVRGTSAAAAMDVRLLCVADSDLDGASWTSQQTKNTGGSNSVDTVTAACPDQQRLLTGGEHIDSLVSPVYGSRPLDGQTWSARADLPPGDTLSVLQLCAPDGEPVATFTSTPDNPTNSTTATFSFTTIDPAGGSAYAMCFLNTSGLGPCDGSVTVTGLTEGENVFSIEAFTDDGRGGAPTENDVRFLVDLTPPTVALSTPPLFTLASKVTVQASGTDNDGIGFYSLRSTAQRSSGSGAGTSNPVTTTTLTASGTATQTLKPGTSYRFQAYAIDEAHNSSTTPAVVRTAAPLDNFALEQSAHWTLVKGTGYTYGEVSRSRTRGATLRHTMFGNTLGIVATTCPSCGQIGVYAGSTLLKKVKLTSRTLRRRQVITVPLHRGRPVESKVTIKVLSAHKTVEIDGLGAVVN